MSEPLSRLYDLALRTLDDQERRADALRSRLGPVLAAAVGAICCSGMTRRRTSGAGTKNL
jgi:hypothetical protein